MVVVSVPQSVLVGVLLGGTWSISSRGTLLPGRYPLGDVVRPTHGADITDHHSESGERAARWLVATWIWHRWGNVVVSNSARGIGEGIGSNSGTGNGS